MAPAFRISEEYDPTPPAARQSAVLLLVTPARELIFIRRADDGRPHSGQIAFPGGMSEEHDPDLVATALRETEEEIGVPGRAVTVLGELTPLYIPVTNFTVWPFVGILEHPAEFICQEDEVDEVITLPVASFRRAITEMDWPYAGQTYQVPTYRFGPPDYPGHSIDVWGATAMITAEFLQIWEEIDSGATISRPEQRR